jgi:hypothetical protein
MAAGVVDLASDPHDGSTGFGGHQDAAVGNRRAAYQLVHTNNGVGAPHELGGCVLRPPEMAEPDVGEPQRFGHEIPAAPWVNRDSSALSVTGAAAQT